MPKNIPQRKEPILDSYILTSVSQANYKHDRHGRYATLVVTDIRTHDDAIEKRNALYRSAYHLDCGLDVEVKEQRDGTYHVVFAAVHKRYRSDHWEPLEIWKRQRRTA